MPQSLVRVGLQQQLDRPSLSGRKRRAQVGAVKWPSGKVAAGQLGRGMYLPQWQRSEVGIHHSVSDRASRRTLIALWENHHGVA
jgi:hypothetical protein